MPTNRVAHRTDHAAWPRGAVVAAVVGLHAVLAWSLLRMAPVRDAVAEVAPLVVSLIPPSAPVTPPDASTTTPAEPPRPLPQRQRPAPAVTAAPSPTPAAPVVQPPADPAPAEPVDAATAEPAPAPPPAVDAPAAPTPPAPKELPASAIQYLEPPAPTYPRASRRLGESGLVVVRVFVDADGLPRQVQVQQSSGHARLDEAAVDAVRHARFRPYVERGQPTAGWARIPIPFELENRP